VTINWLLKETIERETTLAFHILEYILLGMPGSPLRKALIDSKLGEDLAGEGLGSELRQMYFSTGLKGIAFKDADKVEGLILDTLVRLVKEGIDHHTVEAALNTLEFNLRENNTGAFPRGLALMLRALITWLHEGDPLALIAFEAPLEGVKSRVKSKESFFEEMIDQMFLNNLHRSTLILKPDKGLAKKEGADEQEKLSKARKDMSSVDLQEVISNTRELKQIQETPDTPEALATIPTLRLGDLDKRNKTIPLAFLEPKETPVLYHDLFTNGIVYLDLGFNFHALPQKYLPYVRLFGRALLEMGTEREDYVTLTQRISRKTGGIRPAFFTSVVKEGQKAAAWLFLRGKAMQSQTIDLMNIIKDVLLTIRLDNQERFRQMVMEAKARQEQKLVPMGHQMVNLRLRAHFHEAEWAAEQMNGVTYLFFLRKLAKAVDEGWPGVLADLEEMRRILFNRNTMLLNITLDERGWSDFQPQVDAFLEALPASVATDEEWSSKKIPDIEGMIIPAQVNYVAKGTNIYQSGYCFHGSAHVICRYLRSTWLWERVRVQGGAYGAYCLFDRFSGVLAFVSYRDPNLLRTLEAFDETARFLRNIELHEDELKRSIIGTIGDIDKYRLPDAKGYTSMVRHLSGETDEERQKVREEVLSTRAADFRAFAQALEMVKEKGLVKVLGSESAIQEAQADRPRWMQILKVL
ncbi:MAG: insulinase family protein, partial [Candidatus Binatia bacterium]